MDVGEKIKELRKSKGLTQIEFGELFEPKTSDVTIRGWEKGHHNPQFKYKFQIAKMANKSVSEFFGSEHIGEVYGELIVIDDVVNVSKKGSYKRSLICKCSCGNVKSYSPYNIKNGNTQSCGHTHGAKPKDITGKRFGRLVAIERLNKKEHGRYVWKCECDCGKNVAVEISNLTTGSTKSCGCLSSDLASERGKKIAIYTKYHLEKDTAEKGTRLTTINPNKRIQKNNTSGKTGVSFNKRNKKWSAEIILKGKKIRLGYFDKKEDAIKARLKAEEEYFVPILEKHKDVFQQ